MKRREFIRLLGGMAATPSIAWPHAARAQQRERQRLIGVVAGSGDDDMQPLLAALRDKLKSLGWAEGRNLVIEARLGRGDLARLATDTASLVARKPDVIVAQGTPGLNAVRQHSRTVPVVFTLVADPVQMGLIGSLSRPGGYSTGFTNFEFAIGGKWLGLLKELDPRVRHVVVLANPANPNSIPFSQAVERAGRSIELPITTVMVRDAGAIEAAVETAAQQPGGGLIVLPDSLPLFHRDIIIGLSARHHLPAIYPFRVYALDGGLVSYGLDMPDIYRQAAVYVDRILRGEKPADLPVQAPNKFELVINMRTAKTLGITVPLTLQASADETIE
jgi:putative ABC transport system substrate-binding protein